MLVETTPATYRRQTIEVEISRRSESTPCFQLSRVGTPQGVYREAMRGYRDAQGVVSRGDPSIRVVVSVILLDQVSGTRHAILLPESMYLPPKR